MVFKKYRSFMMKCIVLTCIVSCLMMMGGTYQTMAVTGEGTSPAVNHNLPVPVNKEGDGKGVVLMYHHLVPDDLYRTGKYKGNNAVMPVVQFDAQMKYLSENGYTTLFMSELNSYIRKGIALPKKCVVITFDDGYESNYVYALPILKKYNVKATIAVVVASTVKDSSPGNTNTFDPAVLSHLTFNQMREMQDSGLVEFGSHSYDGHALIPVNASGDQGKFFLAKKFLDSQNRIENTNEYLQRIDDDLRLSKYTLEKELGTPIKYFAYPYGANNETVKQAVARAGYEIAVTVKVGQITKASDPLVLNRKNVDPNLTISQYAQLLNQ